MKLLFCALLLLPSLAELGSGGGGDDRRPDVASPYFDELESSPAKVAALAGDEVYLQCVVRGVGNKSVSWLRHLDPVPALLALNNLTNSPDERLTALHSPGSEVFVLRMRSLNTDDSGHYECQVGSKEGKPGLRRVMYLDVVEPVTEIVGASSSSSVEVAEGAALNVTCAVAAGSKELQYIFWTKDEKIVQFDGGLPSSTPNRPLPRDSRGRSLSRLTIPRATMGDAGVYVCTPSSRAAAAKVRVRVIPKPPSPSPPPPAQPAAPTEALASGEGVGRALSASSASASPTSNSSPRLCLFLTAMLVAVATKQ